MHGLYAIVDVATLAGRQLDPLRFADAVLEARPVALQVRDKRHRAAETLALLRAVAPRCRERDVLCFANDRPDLAALAGCDGVHLGQQDLPVADARRVLAELGCPEARIGASVHDPEELAASLAAAPDYIALGPVYDTGSKAQPEPTIGLDGLGSLAAAARDANPDRPLVAIGGLDATRIGPVGQTVRCAAVIGALLPPADAKAPYLAVTAAAARLVEALEAPWS